MENKCSVKDIPTDKQAGIQDDPIQLTDEREKRVKFKKDNPNNISIDYEENEGLDDTRLDGLRNEASHYNIFEKFEDETQKQIYIKTTQELELVAVAKGCGAVMRKAYLKLKSGCVKIHSNLKFQMFLNFVTIYVLFADYFRIIIFQSYADIGFDIVTIICMVLFGVELVIYVVVDKNYLFSFFFFADLITTTFLIFDITMVADRLFNFRNYDNGSQMAVKFAKIIRIIRLTRILRFFRKGGAGSAIGNIRKIMDKKSFSSSRGKESKVTKKLKESNIKKLLTLIIVLLIGVPLIDADVYFNKVEYELEDKTYFALYEYLVGGESTISYLKEDLKEYKAKLASFRVDDKMLYKMDNFKNLRLAESLSYSGNIEAMQKTYFSELHVSSRYEHVIQAVLDILNTIVVGVVLIFSIYNLNKDVSYLVLNPLERMIRKVKAVSIDPFKAMKNKSKFSDNRDEMNETLIIERAINKISELLVLGFGQAGSKIITHFLFDPDKDFDQIIPGEKMYAIFGFCDIRNFTDATEVLLEDVMGFVNKVAEIVHSSVDKYGGAANKNIGDAFLLVWKLIEKEPESLDAIEMKSGDMITKNHFNRQLAELSLLSFVKIIIEINTQQHILEYKLHEGLNARVPGYSVKMGFGLHVGWAIEGAIGSSFKIDASYLSPNVNLSSRLEAATKQFGVSILFSGQIFDMFNNQRLIQCCRHIDTVVVKGSQQPLRLYTIDLYPDNLTAKPVNVRNDKKFSSIKLNILETLQSKFGLTSKKMHTLEEHNKQLDEFQILKLKSYEDEGLVANTLDAVDFRRILGFPREANDSNFRTVFAFGVDSYLNGDWTLAKSFLDKALVLKPHDGPSEVLYEFMKATGFVSPGDWKRCRELVDK